MASSSRSQVTEPVGSASAFLTCDASSISVPWRPSPATVVVTHLVTRVLRLVQGALVLNLLIRSSGQVVQDRPGVSALWADVPGSSTRVTDVVQRLGNGVGNSQRSPMVVARLVSLACVDVAVTRAVRSTGRPCLAALAHEQLVR